MIDEEGVGLEGVLFKEKGKRCIEELMGGDLPVKWEGKGC